MFMSLIMTPPEIPWWKNQGLVVAGSWHPLCARIRAGNVYENDEELFAYEFTKKNFDALKNRGVTLYVGQFDRGYSFLDQAPYVALARKASDAMHRRGIRFGVYMANTIYFESVLKEEPRCENWAVQTHDGRKVHYGGEQTWRWVACFNSPGWIQRMKRMVEIAIREVKADLLHFDNLGVWPEPDSCHCGHCQKAFKVFLQERYPTARAQKRRFGIAGLAHYSAPNFYLRFCPPWSFGQINNPLMQDWIRFRCATVVRYATILRDHAKSLNPKVCMEGNGAGITGLNRSFTHGVDSDRMLKVLDVFWDENADVKIDPAPVRPGEPPVFTHPHRSANLSRRLGKPMIRHCMNARDLCANLAFQGAAGIVAQFGYAEMRTMNRQPIPADLRQCLQYYRKHLSLYRDALPDHRIGIFRNFESLAFNCFDTHRSAAVMEQLLLNRRIGYDILLNSDLEKGALGRYRLLILPNVKYLSSPVRDRLLKYVAGGGALLLTEQTGQYNEEERIRVQPAFGRLFRGLEAARENRVEAMEFDPHQQFKSCFSEGLPAFASHGRGKAAYLPRIQFAEMIGTGDGTNYNVHYRGVDSRYWREPKNSAEILAAIDRLYPGHSPNRIVAGHGIFQGNVRWKDGRRGLMLFNQSETVSHGVPLILKKARKVTMYDPEKEKPLNLTVRKTRNGCEAVIPSIKHHLVIQWRE